MISEDVIQGLKKHFNDFPLFTQINNSQTIKILTPFNFMITFIFHLLLPFLYTMNFFITLRKKRQTPYFIDWMLKLHFFPLNNLSLVCCSDSK